MKMRTYTNRITKACVVVVLMVVALSWMYISYLPRQVFYTSCSEMKPFENQNGLGLFLTAESKLKSFEQQNETGLGSPVESSMMARARYVNKMCQQLDWKTSYVNARTPVFFYAKPNGLLACKTPKTGSTLIGALIRALTQPSDNSVSDMFKLGRNTIHNGLNEVWDVFAVEPIRDATLTVMVTRDPFSRLFSTFIDKYFLLGRLGRELAIHLKRGFRGENGYCGYDVTFQEFLDYVVYLAQTKKEVNEHVVPVSQLCDVCNIKYDLICSQEHLNEGIEEVLKMTNKITSDRLKIIRQSISNTSAYASLRSLISSHMFDYNNNRPDCPNIMSFMAKMWETFQVQGLVNSQLNFPEQLLSPFSFVEKEAHNITTAILKVMQSKPLSKKGRQQQRLTAQTSAYRDIKWKTIANLQKVFQLDFLFFDYSNYPPGQ